MNELGSATAVRFARNGDAPGVRVAAAPGVLTLETRCQLDVDVGTRVPSQVTDGPRRLAGPRIRRCGFLAAISDNEVDGGRILCGCPWRSTGALTGSES